MVQQCRSMRSPQRGKRPPGSSVREAPFRLVRDATVDGQPNDGLTLDGYGAVFNSSTVIDSWEGRFRETIASGAMKRSFRETPPKIQFDHGKHPLIGSLPVASLVSISEDSDPVLAPDGGAHIVGRLLDNWLVAPVRDAIAAGVVDGMSFRFEVVREAWATADGIPLRDEMALMREMDRVFLEDLPDDELPLRTLRELKVPEMGPVTWPAYTDTSVGVRSKVIDLGRLGDPAQRNLLARAVFMADRLEAEPESQRAEDTPMDEDQIGTLAGSLDATLDQALQLIGGVDPSTLPPDVAQGHALIAAAGAISDQLLDELGVYDPDDADDNEPDSGDSGRSSAQRPARAAGKRPLAVDAQQPAEQAGTHPPEDVQQTTGPSGSVGKRQSNPIPKRMSSNDLRLRNQRSRLMTFRDIGERP